MKPNKNIPDAYKHWRNNRPHRQYWWPQVDYLSANLHPYHLTLEINDQNAHKIHWPVDCDDLPLPADPLDYRNRLQPDMSKWPIMLTEYAGVPIHGNTSTERRMLSYHDYMEHAELSNSKCTDIDAIELTAAGYVGIEATHLRMPMKDRNEALRLFEIILNKRLYDDTVHGLVVQRKVMDRLSGRLFLFVYNVRNGLLIEKGNSLRFEVDDDFLRLLKRRDTNAICSRAHFDTFIRSYLDVLNGNA